MGESLIIVRASFILDLGRGPVFKYPFDSGKKLLLAEYFERNKIAHFLFALATACSMFKFKVFCQPTARRYSSARVNYRELKTCENNILIFCNVFF